MERRGGLEPEAGQGGQTCGEAALPSPSWLPFLHQPLNTALSLSSSGERLLQRQLRAREQPQALPVFLVCTLCRGRAGPQQVCGQRPGEVLWLQRRLQVLWWAWQVGQGAGTEAGTEVRKVLKSRTSHLTGNCVTLMSYW